MRNGRIETHGKVIDHITETQEEFYGFDENAFDESPADSRVMVLLSYP